MPNDELIPLAHYPDTADGCTDRHADEPDSVHHSYHRCITCPDLGRSCGGPKLAALGAFETVRSYHKILRSTRGITVARICAAAPQLGHGTVSDYFGRGGPDPKWITVVAIDTALISICGDRVGEPPLEHTCPAVYADLHARNEALASRLTEAEQEIARLTETLATAEENAQTRLTNQRADLDKIILLQQARIAALEAEKADYLARNDRKRTELDAARAEIRELNRANLQITREFAAKMLDMSDKLLAATEK